MSNYVYTIRQPDGQLNKGKLEAPTYNEAIAKVHKLGGLAVEVKEEKGKGANSKTAKYRVNLKERIIFTEQLAVMLNAGITLVQAIKGLAEESTNKSLVSILTQVVEDVEGGMQFSGALARQPQTFSNIYCQMVRSAEKTGNLAEVLNRLTLQQQKEYELKGKIRGALMYPAIISILLVGVVILVITFILPKLSVLFNESGTALPASTRFLMGLSDFFVHDWYVLIIGAVILAVAMKMALRTPKGRMAWDALKIRLPVIGTFSRKTYMARFAQNFASLVKAGVPVLDVFHTLRDVIGNAVYEVEIEKISKDVENGIKVSTAIRKSRYFPPMVGQLVSVGEQSGDLAGIFEVLGDFFEKEVDGMAKNLSTLLEPIIMIVMGAAIGFVLVSIIQPIYGLVNAV